MHYGTRTKLREQNIPFSRRAARQITNADYDKYDYILGMDDENMRYIAKIIGSDSEHKVSMLMDFAGEHRSIADPWYTGNFDATFDDVMRGCQGLLKHITQK